MCVKCASDKQGGSTSRRIGKGKVKRRLAFEVFNGTIGRDNFRKGLAVRHFYSCRSIQQ